MRRFMLGVFTFTLSFGVFLIITIPYNTAEDIGYGLPASFLPNLLAYGIILFSFIELVKVYLNKEENRPSPIDSKKLIHLLKFFTITALAMPLMELITFIPGAIIVITAFQWVIGQRDPKMIGIISVTLSIAIYLLTTKVLLIHLP